MINMGVIGTGDFGLDHIRTIKSMTGAKLFGICDKNEKKLNNAAKEYNVPATRTYTSVTELLKEKELDAVIIVTDEKSHEPLTRKAVQYGKHVLLEKPISKNLKDAEKIQNLASNNDVIILPGHMLRFDPGYAEINKKLSNVKGQIHSLRMKRNVPIERFYLHARTHPVFMALSHDIDQLIWNVKSTPKRIYAMEKKIDSQIDTSGVFFGLIEMENGVICSLETQWCLPDEYGQYIDVEFEAMYDGGHIKYRFPGDTLSVMDNGNINRPDIQLAPNIHGNVYGALRNELEHFIEMIRNRDVEQIVPLEDAVLGIKICQTLITSAKEGREILWEEF